MNIKDRNWNLQSSYLALPDCFYEKIRPSTVNNPKLTFFNKELAKKLNLNFLNADKSLTTNYLSGNILPKNSEPIAQAYAGHQFGHFTMLGDGRAVLLGEQKDIDGKLFDIQLKGSGKTSYSRAGDGRATLSSMLREYLISESMYFLNVPTTRSLAVVDSGEKGYRESIRNGGILTRIAASHIRVGTFEYGNQFCSKEDFKNFTDHVINRYYTEILDKESPYLELLSLMMKKQIDLIVNWVRVGFIHGVMNTDNMSITGETIDYGPCAFLNKYDPKTVFSSIDLNGRYAFGNQHKIAYWNLCIFAETILPLINNDKDKAIKSAQDILNQFPVEYSRKWYEMMCNKLGLLNPVKEDEHLISKLLTMMETYHADYTNTFSALTMNKSCCDSLFNSKEFKKWKTKWLERIGNNEDSYRIMKMNNPIYIPRNHLVEIALSSAVSGDKKEFNKLLATMSETYSYEKKHHNFQAVPDNHDKSYKTFCGT